MKRTFLVKFQHKGEVLVNAEDYDKARAIVQQRADKMNAQKDFLLCDMVPYRPVVKEEKK